MIPIIVSVVRSFRSVIALKARLSWSLTRKSDQTTFCSPGDREAFFLLTNMAPATTEAMTAAITPYSAYCTYSLSLEVFDDVVGDTIEVLAAAGVRVICLSMG